VELFVRDGKLRFRIPGQPGDHPLLKQDDDLFTIERDYEIRFLSRNGRVDWSLVYAGGLLLDAKRRVAR
jgi:hypothetical protein